MATGERELAVAVGERELALVWVLVPSASVAAVAVGERELAAAVGERELALARVRAPSTGVTAVAVGERERHRGLDALHNRCRHRWHGRRHMGWRVAA